MRKLMSLILVVLLVLCSCAIAETEPAPLAAEDFQGLWNLDYAVAEGMQVTAAAYGLVITMTINEEKTQVTLKLSVDTKYGSVMDYCEIFMGRMILCRKAAQTLGLEFKLIINGQHLI